MAGEELTCGTMDGGPASANAQARLRAVPFASGRSMHDIAQDVVERRVRFDE